jgi:UPF0755 protein
VEAYLNKEGLVKDTAHFDWVARRMNYQNKITPGRYKVTAGITTRQFIHMLREGKPLPLEITLHDIRFKENLAGTLGRNLEADSASLLSLMNSDTFLTQYNLTPENVLCMFMDNTYKFVWTSTPKDVFKRMYYEYDKLWNDDRIAKAKALRLSPVQVMILASIVQEEVKHRDEAPKVAEAYLNRLRRNIALGADPTIKYVMMKLNNGVKPSRILNRDLEIESPYNTYKHTGLPPGPVNLPAAWAVDGVLNPEHHDYIYFVASTLRPGYHEFSKSAAEHEQKAALYHKKLNAEGVMR